MVSRISLELQRLFVMLVRHGNVSICHFHAIAIVAISHDTLRGGDEREESPFLRGPRPGRR